MMSTVGMLCISPQIHFWFKFLDTTIPGTSNPRILAKLALDQLLFCPYIIACNFGAVNLFKNKGHFDMEAYQYKLNNELFASLKQAWMIWPLTNFVLFKYVPIDYRLLISNFVSVYWNGYLSIIGNRETTNKHDVVLVEPTTTKPHTD
ncbi:hypothetical protein SAMD00019534_095150 [Acytostelium subglobosum LB1]|uniref:hypothetical protein n=1 Tax=Acytostelium subglobosum LB1 TaxID=1410327 RepID=UPI000645181E|nr:hypothetical protein SAMD00019534_095150 [Acytostelium subglobosum LB1]GAM26340.1 hypothetical protein SAMD00019534_095150 [Acytostelium subglobosum LB1]|eukprot:XP_012750894.1 hypothetical protein SAMD00019534_095150 [Acytostelium subglobosum LB1]